MNSFCIEYKSNKYIYIYYLLLHVICLSWTNTAEVAPTTMFRLAITFSVFIPLVKYFWIAPAVIILFVGLRFNSVSPFGYIPQTWEIYEGLIIIIAIIHSLLYKEKSLLRFSDRQILFLLFLFFIELINFNVYSSIIPFVVMLFILFNAIKTKTSFNLAMLSFVVLSITLSIYYFVFAKEFVQSYYGSDADRSAWLDPNYFGLVLGSGVIISGAYVFSAIKTNISYIYRSVFVGCIILGVVVVILQASRGAILAISGALLLQIFLAKVPIQYKLFAFLLSVIGIVCLFQAEYFTLLADRTLDDDGSGSGRGDIWVTKLSDWSSSFFNYWGGGYQASIKKIRPLDVDCHNEFVSIILNYGIIGFIIFSRQIIVLFENYVNRAFVWSFLVFLFVAFFTLSPITCQTGWTASPFLILLMYKYVKLEKQERMCTNNSVEDEENTICNADLT